MAISRCSAPFVSRLLSFISFAIVTWLGASPVRGGTMYVIINIGEAVDQGSGTYPIALNNAGQAVGLVYGSGSNTPFLFSEGTSTLLDVSNFSPSAMNDNGDMAGYTFTASEHTHAALYQGGQVYDLGTFPGADGDGIDYSAATGINNSGQITGAANTTTLNANDDPEEHAFLYQGSTMTDLGALTGDVKSTAAAINDNGAVVGLSEDASGNDRAVLFSGGKITDLQPLLGSGIIFSSAIGINDDGQIVGTAISGSAGGFSFIDTDGKVSHTGEIQADAINSEGQVAGETANSQAAVFTNNTAYDLQEAVEAGAMAGFSSLDYCVAINNDGLILGVGTLESGLQGSFIAMPSTALAGTYDGLASVSSVNVGYFKIVVQSTDAFTATLETPGHHYPFTGKLSLSGAFQGTIKISRTLSLQVSLTRDLGAGTVSGTITNGSTVYQVAAKEYAAYSAKTPAPEAGAYTVALPPASNMPAGEGWATLNVSALGTVQVAGKLGDGAAVSVLSHLHKDGTFALYNALYAAATPGAIVGEPTFESLSESDCDGVLEWTKPAQANPKQVYASGFNGQVSLMGAHFAKPALAAGSYTFTASGGGITTIQHMISIPAKGALTVTNPAADKLTLTLSQTTGTYSGSFLPAGAKARTAFSGVVYQKEATQSGGVFPGETTTGVISFP